MFFRKFTFYCHYDVSHVFSFLEFHVLLHPSCNILRFFLLLEKLCGAALTRDILYTTNSKYITSKETLAKTTFIPISYPHCRWAMKRISGHSLLIVSSLNYSKHSLMILCQFQVVRNWCTVRTNMFEFACFFGLLLFTKLIQL